MYDYVIYGGGPIGIVTGLLLSKKGYKVSIIEKTSTLGGCWRVEWKNGYFTEHSPRVTNDGDNFSKLFDILGLDFTEETIKVYSNRILLWCKYSGFYYRVYHY